MKQTEYLENEWPEDPAEDPSVPEKTEATPDEETDETEEALDEETLLPGDDGSPFRPVDPLEIFHLENPPEIEDGATNSKKAEACLQYYFQAQSEMRTQAEKGRAIRNRYTAGFLHYYEPALNYIVTDFMRRYAMEGHFEDLKQAAAMGILKAVENYQYEKKAAFRSYALKYIENELHKYVRVMRRGRTVSSDDAYKKLRTVMAVFSEMGGQMDDDVLQVAAEEAGVSPARAKEMILAGLQNMKSVDVYQRFDRDGSEAENGSLAEIAVCRAPSPYQVLLKKELEAVLYRAWSRLDYRQQMVLAEHLGFCPECFSVLQRNGASGACYDCTPRKKVPFEDIAISHGFSSPDTAARQYKSAVERFRTVYKEEFSRVFLPKRTPQDKP